MNPVLDAVFAGASITLLWLILFELITISKTLKDD